MNRGERVDRKGSLIKHFFFLWEGGGVKRRIVVNREKHGSSRVQGVLLHNGGFCNASQNGFCSYKLSIHRKTKIMQIMKKII
jgi:hypothetical protein